MRVRRAVALALLPVAGLPFLIVPAGTASTTPAAGFLRSQSLDDLKLREREAAGDLEDSSAEVRAAGAALRTVEGKLPAARRAVATAKGELAGARAKAAAATAEVRRAEAQAAAARKEVDAASARVEEGREEVGRLARHTYQRGRLSDLRDVMEAGEPQDALVRVGMLRAVFRSQNGSLTRLTQDRLELAGTRADLEADERDLERAREAAEQQAARARAVAVQAEQAAKRVEQLAAERRAVLASAEKHRAQDLADYRKAQADSRALAEKIRAAAARAAAARAAEERRKKAERKRRAQAGQPAAPRAEPRSGRMLWPTPGRLTSRYGYRTHPIYGDRRMHTGIDIGAPNGTRVSAADSGVVTFAGDGGGFGNFVVISHRTVDGKDVSTAYAHMESIAVREGQLVNRGDPVGGVGSTGNSTGNHLHFEVRLDGNPVDPLDYVDPP